MTRARLLLPALAVPALLAIAAPAPATARQRALKVPLPSAGDITVAHVVFKRSASRVRGAARRLPRFRVAGRRSRRLLRAYGVGAVGGSFRVGPRRAVGSVVLLRRREGAGQRRTPRRAAALIATDGALVYAVRERNALADLRRRRATAADQFVFQLDLNEGFEPFDGFEAPEDVGDLEDPDASGLGACRLGTKFRLIGNPDPTRPALSLFVDLPTGDNDVPSDDAGLNGLGFRERNWVFDIGYRSACDDTESFEDTPAEAVFDQFIPGLGAPSPVVCQVVSTRVGPVLVDGKAVTRPSFSTQFGCDTDVDGVTVRFPGRTITDCEDSAGRDCLILGDVTRYLFPLRAGETQLLRILSDPDFEPGDRFQLEIDTPRANLRVEDVM